MREEVVEEASNAKKDYTEEDVYQRARGVAEQAATWGTTRLRSYVETDPQAGLRSFEALKEVRADLAFALDIELCAFAQEGLTQEMQTYDLMREALAGGADLAGGCPYQDDDPARHIELVFDLAEEAGVPADFHLDFDLDPAGSSIPKVAEETKKRGHEGRVSIGHVSKLAAMRPERFEEMARLLAEAGIALTVLPATDLYLLMGRDAERERPRGVARAAELAERGVTTSIASNNVRNPFTPYGDASLVRVANLFANAAHLGLEEDLHLVFEMISTRVAGHAPPVSACQRA